LSSSTVEVIPANSFSQCCSSCIYQVFVSTRAGRTRLFTQVSPSFKFSIASAYIYTDDGVTLVIWGNAEAAVTIMAASVPMLRMLFRGVRPSPRRHGHHSSHRSGRSRRHLVDTGYSKRVYYYNKPRKDLVTMSGSTWFSDTHFTSTNHTRNASVGEHTRNASVSFSTHTRNASASRSRS